MIAWDATAHIVQITLGQSDPFAQELCHGLATLLASQHIAVTLGEI
jgi:hypothetical protein